MNGWQDPLIIIMYDPETFSKALAMIETLAREAVVTDSEDYAEYNLYKLKNYTSFVLKGNPKHKELVGYIRAIAVKAIENDFAEYVYNDLNAKCEKHMNKRPEQIFSINGGLFGVYLRRIGLPTGLPEGYIVESQLHLTEETERTWLDVRFYRPATSTSGLGLSTLHKVIYADKNRTATKEGSIGRMIKNVAEKAGPFITHLHEFYVDAYKEDELKNKKKDADKNSNE